MFKNLNISNKINEDIQNKAENEKIIPAYKRNEYISDETMVQSRLSIYSNSNNQTSNNLRKSVYNNTMTSSFNYNSNSNNDQFMINHIPCINCNNMISIDDIGKNRRLMQ